MNWKRWLIGELSWRRLLIALVEIYLLVMLGGLLIADRLIFLPRESSYTRLLPGVFRVPVNDLESVAVMAFTNQPSAPVILYLHGNAEDIGELSSLFEEYAAQGFTVYAFDYRGYGCSDGKPGTRHARQDAEAVYQYITKTCGVDPKRLIIHGRSVGAAFAIQLAADHPETGGLVVQSGFVSAFRTVTKRTVFIFDALRNHRLIRKIACPVLFIHGNLDAVIPIWHGRELYDVAPEPKDFYEVDGAGHDDVPDVGGEAYWARIRAFASGLTAR